jgi:hypothetical protein
MLRATIASAILWWTPHWRAVFSDEAEEGSGALMRLDPVTLTPIADEEPVKNPYGMMPFTYLHIDPHHETFWNQSQGDELVELTLKAGRQQTQTNDLFNRTGHKQLVSHGNALRRDSQKSLLDPGAHILVHGDGSTTIVDWSIDFESRQRVVDNDEARAAGTYGINPERLRKTSYQTAEGARVTERPLEERRHKMREPLGDGERDHRYNCITVARIDRVDVEELPDPDVYMEVIHGPIAYPGDPAKQIDVDSAKYKRNLDLRRKGQEYKQAGNVPDDPRNDSAEDEENGRQGPAIRDDGKPDPSSPLGDQ